MAWLRLAVICCMPVLVFSQATETGSITGRVVNASTGEAISGATVSIEKTGFQTKPTGIAPATSQLDGSFHFGSVPAGGYLFFVRKPGFVDNVGLEATVQSNQSTSDITIALIPPETITGKVVDENNRALAGAQMYALTYDPLFKPPRIQPAGVHAVTDRAGHYSLSKLSPGSYYILAIPKPSAEEPGKNAYRRMPTFYPEASSLDKAMRVFVQPGEQTSADVRIQPVRTYRIEGKIADTISERDVEIEVSPHGERQIPVLRSSVTVHADRRFVAEGIPSGSYDIRLFARSHAWGIPLGIERVTVDSSDVLDVAITPLQRAAVNVVAVLDSNTAGPMSPVSVLVRCEEAEWGQRSGPDGVARFDDLAPGHCLVHVVPRRPGLYVSSLQLNNRDIQNQYVDLSQASSLQITAVLRAGAGTIAGTVEQGFNMVMLEPQAPSPDGSDIQHQTVNADGSFEFRNLAPGDYFLYASQATNWNLWHQPEFLDLLRDVATPVHLDENETQRVGPLTGIERPILRARAMIAGFYFE